MANNRMWLLHRPSGKAVMLGKRLAGPWYLNNSPDFDAFFDEVGGFCDDDFCLAMEDCSGAPLAFDEWKYTEDALPVRRLEIVHET